MRAIQLGKVAARAEVLRIRRLIARTIVRAICGAIAAVFVIGTLIAVHVAIAIALVPHLGPVGAPLVVAGGDLVIAIVFGLIALLKGPGRIEREALEVRQTAQEHMMEFVTVSAIVLPLLRRTLGRRAVDIAFGSWRLGKKGGMGKAR